MSRVPYPFTCKEAQSHHDQNLKNSAATGAHIFHLFASSDGAKSYFRKMLLVIWPVADAPNHGFTLCK
jgi:hypothetical protein